MVARPDGEGCGRSAARDHGAMFTAIRLALVLALVAACDGTPATIDAAVDAPLDAGPDAAATCAELTAALQARLGAADRACQTVADCAVIGATVDRTGSSTCNCGVYFAPQCGGAVVNRAAWQADREGGTLSADWFERCAPAGAASGAPEVCDCAPTHYDCVESRCVATTPFDCFRPGDAGVADGG